MAAEHTEHALTPTNYIAHHLSFMTKPVGDGAFMSLNVDSLVMSILIGFVGIGFMWWVVRDATAGVPGKRQAFVELAVDFVNDQAKSIFSGDIRFIAPLGLTVFVWVLLMNSLDFLPGDLMGLVYKHVFGLDTWRQVPTADVNTTFALALAVWALMLFYSVKVKGLGGWLHEMFCAPFGANPILWIPNFLFNVIEYISKPLSHSLRLYGNMYAGEIIFLLLGVWAATGLAGTFFGALLATGWAIFHILIVSIQAYIFMMLTIVYVAMAHESH